jgi:hypothetical protein
MSRNEYALKAEAEAAEYRKEIALVLEIRTASWSMPGSDYYDVLAFAKKMRELAEERETRIRAEERAESVLRYVCANSYELGAWE